MSALPLIEAVQRAGGAITLRGDRLRLSAPEPLPESLLQELRTHKAEVIDHLQHARQSKLGQPARDGPYVTGASDPLWQKWRPSDPTCPHWYRPRDLERLIAAYIAHDAEQGRERTVRELVAEFRGLSGSLKQKAVLDATGLHRIPLSRLYDGQGIDQALLGDLLAAMMAHARPVPPQALGIIGKERLQRRFEAAGCEMETFQYKQVKEISQGLPWVVETAFAWCPEGEARRLITGVNWSPGIVNPFRSLGRYGESLDTVLSQQRADRREPVILVLHLACPRVEYTDRGKSAVVVER